MTFDHYHARVLISQARVFRLRGHIRWAIWLQVRAMVARCRARPALPVQGRLL